MLRRTLRLKTFIITLGAGLVILAGLAVGLVRLADAAVPEYRSALAERVSERLGGPVTIGGMDLTWSWAGPVLRLADVALVDGGSQQPLLRLESLAIEFSLWGLARGQWRQPRSLRLVGLHVGLERDEDSGIRVVGMAGREEAPARGIGLDQLIDWVAALESVHVEDAAITWHREAEQALTVGALDLALRNRAPRHWVRGSMRLPEAWGGIARIDVFAKGALADWRSLDVHGYFAGQRVRLAPFLRMAGASDELRGGVSDLEVFADWRAGGFEGARVSASAGAFHHAQNGRNRLVLPGLAMDANVARDTVGYAIELSAVRGVGSDSSAHGRLHWSEVGGLRGRLDGLAAELALDVAKLAMPQRLAGWRAGGMLPRVAFNAAPGLARFDARADFRQLALTDPDAGIHLGRIDGSVQVSDDAGLLRVDAGSGQLRWPAYLAGELPIEHLSGELGWRRAADGWGLRADALQWRGLRARVAGGGELRLPDDTAPVADLAFDVQVDELDAVAALVPQREDLPNPRLRDWLPRGLTAGRITSGQVRLRGPLDRFPFADGGGHFSVTASGEGLRLDYKPGWPVLEAVAGRFRLVGDTMEVTAERGRMLGVDLGPAKAHIADVREPILEVQGQVPDGDAGEMLAFLPASPLNEKFGRLADVLSVSGTADLDLDLRVPLKPELGEMAFDGRVAMEGVRLAHAVLPAPVTGIDGQLRFDRQGVYATGVEGNYLDLPVTADLEPKKDGALAIDARVLTRLPRDRQALAEFVPAPVLARAEGEALWRIGVRVSAGKLSDLTLTSDLHAMRLALPSPLDKPAGTALDTRIRMKPDRSRVALEYGDRLNLRIRRTDDGQRALDMHVGSRQPTAPDGPGLWVGGRIESCRVRDWQAFLNGFENDGPPLALRGTDLEFGELVVLGQRYESVTVDLVPLTVGTGWEAEISGKGARGTLRWTETDGEPRLTARLERLKARLADEPDAPISEGNEQPLDPSKLPALDIVVDELHLGDEMLGRLSLTADRSESGIVLRQARLSGGALEANGSGVWERADGMSNAEFRAEADGTGMAEVLRALGYKANIHADEIDLSTHLAFGPDASGLSVEKLSGNLELTFKSGTLETVEPGAGRVVGLFNFYALPRRLLLNFRDVVNEGLAFDEIEGRFDIQQGRAHIDDLQMDTPSADIDIRGTVDLAGRTYDQHVTVVPQLSPGVALTGTVIGGPVVGLAILVTQGLLDKPIEKLSTVTYHLTGSWEDPKVERVRATAKADDDE